MGPGGPCLSVSVCVGVALTPGLCCRGRPAGQQGQRGPRPCGGGASAQPRAPSSRGRLGAGGCMSRGWPLPPWGTLDTSQPVCSPPWVCASGRWRRSPAGGGRRSGQCPQRSCLPLTRRRHPRDRQPVGAGGGRLFLLAREAAFCRASVSSGWWAGGHRADGRGCGPALTAPLAPRGPYPGSRGPACSHVGERVGEFDPGPSAAPADWTGGGRGAPSRT